MQISPPVAILDDVIFVSPVAKRRHPKWRPEEEAAPPSQSKTKKSLYTTNTVCVDGNIVTRLDDKLCLWIEKFDVKVSRSMALRIDFRIMCDILSIVFYILIEYKCIVPLLELNRNAYSSPEIDFIVRFHGIISVRKRQHQI